MLVLVNGSGFNLGRELREAVHDKLTENFTRFSDRILKIQAYLEDVNGPKKGADKFLRLVIDIKSQPAIVIEENGRVWLAILEIAIDRAGQTFSRQVKRFRSAGDRTSMAGDGESLHVERSSHVTKFLDNGVPDGHRDGGIN